jgi:hypothetical protein
VRLCLTYVSFLYIYGYFKFVYKECFRLIKTVLEFFVFHYFPLLILSSFFAMHTNEQKRILTKMCGLCLTYVFSVHLHEHLFCIQRVFSLIKTVLEFFFVSSLFSAFLFWVHFSRTWILMSKKRLNLNQKFDFCLTYVSFLYISHGHQSFVYKECFQLIKTVLEFFFFHYFFRFFILEFIFAYVNTDEQKG